MRVGCLRFVSISFGLTLVLSASSTILLAQRPSAAVGAADGGAREVLVSIFIPPKPNAPFFLTLDTEWTRPLGNGGAYTLVNERHIARDSAGRIYQERWILTPKNGHFESSMNRIEIADPAQHTRLNCVVAVRRCTVEPYQELTTTAYRPPVQPSHPLPNGEGFYLHEDLGKDNLLGFDTDGYRETITLNPGSFGNDRPMVTTREFWYSPALAINLISRLDSPQSGKQTFTAKEISRAEPDPKLFARPEGFTLEYPDHEQ
jgi:hypothetical protein